jgi:hypothetical protein
MSDQPVVISGQSEAQVAHEMAREILVSLEGKSWSHITRIEYLKAHYECLMVLRGLEPR